MKILPRYEDLLDICKIETVYYEIKSNSKHKDKFTKYELFLISNFITILTVLKNKTYQHGNYNIFLIADPKYRVIMSENLNDKIINHLVSKYILFPVLENKLISTNVATRKNKGTKAGIYYMKKYINKIKQNHDNFYILKCDINKYFYSIDHQILFQQLQAECLDDDTLNIIKIIIESTENSYVNLNITNQILKEKEAILSSKRSKKEKTDKLSSLNKIPLYKPGKGLPIGNMSSQILAIYYLNKLDHFIKEKLKIKYYIRYMDDFILIHDQKEYLEYCLLEIKKELEKLKLKLNNKTAISEIHQGVNFLGYRFFLKNKKLIIKLNKKTKQKLIKKMKDKSLRERKDILKKNKSNLHQAHSKGLIYQLKFYNLKK